MGPKTAKQIILDLKDKIAKEELSAGTLPQIETQVPASGLREEAISALMNLGFRRTQVLKLVDKSMADHSEITQVEVLLRVILKQL